ncbi:MAG: spore gernimation protein [Paenibacillaceae bacterium]|jgi:spore germination protein KB|nr:spore gernimation protein [Paenibacillaceae bacterium]
MKIRITSGMLMALVINMIYAKSIGITQGIAAREVGADMWIATLFSIMQGAFMIWLTAVAVRRAGGKELIDAVGIHMGKWTGKAAALLMFLFFTGAFAGVMITFVYHLMDYFLPQVPVYVFIIIPLAVGCFGAFHGLEVMARMAFVGVFTILCLNISLLAGSFYEFDIRNLAPVLQNGVGATLWASRHNDTEWAVAVMMAAIILPLVNNRSNWGKSSVVSMLMGGLLVVMWPLMEAGVLSAEVAGQYVVACMQMARSAHLGHFIHRYEMIMIVFFATSTMVQIMMCLFCASHCLSKTFGIKDYRPLLVPAALVLGAFSYWIVTNHFRAMRWEEAYWPYISLPIAIALPLLLLAGGMIRRSKS